jgi:hypothetical protein
MCLFYDLSTYTRVKILIKTNKNRESNHTILDFNMSMSGVDFRSTHRLALSKSPRSELLRHLGCAYHILNT